MINIFQPTLGQDELNELSKVFESNWVGKGEYVDRFEKLFAINLKANSENFISTTSCTEGIFLAADVFNFTPEDEIIVPSISFPSVASAVLSKGAKIVLCDVDKSTLNVNSEHIAKVISKKTKAVFVTHYGGIPCDMDPIIKLCHKNNIKVIEDSACSVQSFYKGKACGTIGDMGIWSFDAMKTICTGDGGMIYLKSLDNVNIAKELLYLGLPVKTKSGMDSSTRESNWWEFEINRPGRRATMNNIAGAIGCVQMERLPSFIKRRKQIFNKYFSAFKNIDWIDLPEEPNFNYESSYYFFWIQTKYRDQLAKHLLKHDIYTTFRYWPLHKIKLFNKKKIFCDDSEYASNYTLNIPLHQSLNDEDVDKVINTIKSFKEKK